MHNKLVSIIMPAYNAVDLIKETLDSVKNQSYPNWELIVVEDGSDDGTKAIIDKFRASVDQKVIYFRNEINKGLPATRNIAAAMAKGRWYALLDSDDIWHKNHLLSLSTTAQENPNYDLIYGAHFCFSKTIDNTVLDNNLSKKSKNLPLSLINGYIIQPSGIMVSSNAFTAIDGFDESYRYVEDLNFYFRLLQKGYGFKYTGQTTLYYRWNPNGLSRDVLKMSYYLARTYEDAIDWDEIPKKLRYKQTSDKWMIVARMSRKIDSKQAKAAIKKAVKYNFSFETLFYLLLIYMSPHK